MSLLDSITHNLSHPINRGRRLGAALRFARWQLGSRLAPGAVVYDWIGGARFLVRPGDTGLTGNIYTGLHDFEDMGFLLHFLRPGDLFVDVGANAGAYTILACAVAGARGIAFEPIPDTYDRLVENMRLNHLDTRVACLNQAVGARQGTLAFSSGGDTTNHALQPGESCASALEVAVTPLDLALQGDAPALAKIDVEGYETAVLDGARETLSQPSLQAVIVELGESTNGYGHDPARAPEILSAHGFSPCTYSPLQRTLRGLDGTPRRAGNTLFVRDRPSVEERLRRARPVTVHGRQL